MLVCKREQKPQQTWDGQRGVVLKATALSAAAVQSQVSACAGAQRHGLRCCAAFDPHLCKLGVKRMLRVYESRHAAQPLHLRHRVQRQRCLTARLGAKDLQQAVQQLLWPALQLGSAASGSIALLARLRASDLQQAVQRNLRQAVRQRHCMRLTCHMRPAYTAVRAAHLNDLPHGLTSD